MILDGGKIMLMSIFLMHKVEALSVNRQVLCGLQR
jgi:hypothetical protein